MDRKLILGFTVSTASPARKHVSSKAKGRGRIRVLDVYGCPGPQVIVAKGRDPGGPRPFKLAKMRCLHLLAELRVLSESLVV